MAKLSRIQRNDHLKKVIDAQRPKRQALKEAVSNQKLSMEERMEAALKLDKLPRDGSPIRYRNRCVLTGRSRGYLRKFGLSRICFRERANAGLIYGVKKASW